MSRSSLLLSTFVLTQKVTQRWISELSDINREWRFRLHTRQFYMSNGQLQISGVINWWFSFDNHWFFGCLGSSALVLKGEACLHDPSHAERSLRASILLLSRRNHNNDCRAGAFIPNSYFTRFALCELVLLIHPAVNYFSRFLEFCANWVLRSKSNFLLYNNSNHRKTGYPGI